MARPSQLTQTNIETCHRPDVTKTSGKKQMKAGVIIVLPVCFDHDVFQLLLFLFSLQVTHNHRPIFVFHDLSAALLCSDARRHPSPASLNHFH